MEENKSLKTENDDAVNENYKRLFGAIYKQAVSDDYKKVCKAVSEKLIMRGINKHRVRQYVSKRSDEIRAYIQKTYMRKPKITDTVQEKYRQIASAILLTES